MNPDLARAFREGAGLVTRRRALACGASPEEIVRPVRGGDWVQVRRGVYAERATYDALDSVRGRRLLADRAACLRVTVPHVRSHESAALELGMDVLLPNPPTTHVTRPGLQGSRNRYGITHHLAPYLPEEQVVIAGGGARVLGAARTAVDIARFTGGLSGVVAVDGAMRLGVTRGELATTLEAQVGWPGVRRAREAVDLADEGSESVGESLARALVGSLGFGRPETQFGLTDGIRTVWVDLRLGRHLFEFDGRHKYGRGSSEADDPAEVVWQEKKRQDFCCGFKLGMSRIVWPTSCRPAGTQRRLGCDGSTSTPARGSARASPTSRRTGPAPPVAALPEPSSAYAWVRGQPGAAAPMTCLPRRSTPTALLVRLPRRATTTAPFDRLPRRSTAYHADRSAR